MPKLRDLIAQHLDTSCEVTDGGFYCFEEFFER